MQPARIRHRRNAIDTMPDPASPESPNDWHLHAMDTGVGTTGAAAGGMGGNDMPATSLNNPFSGHVILTVPDVMANPLSVTYRTVFITVKAQHPLMQLLVDATETDVSDQTQLTVTKVEFYGASSGLISLQPFVQRPQLCFTNTGVAAHQAQFRGQQMVDSGTISRKPFLSHTFGDSIHNTRYINVLPTDNTSPMLDTLFTYQYVQKAATPQPIDAGYLRIAFIMRNNNFVPIGTAILAVLDVETSVEETKVKSRKRQHEFDQMMKIDKIKRLTMPTLDSA